MEPIAKQGIFQKLFLRKASHLIFESLRAFSRLNYFILKSNIQFKKKKWTALNDLN